ncbi:competence protein ComEC [Mucilaginibacter mallensis]|uniref:Competence protein ComEC n=1 Tax=Mucilaginibacter mallensis TaxID=652787 RepID=A0A1H1ZAE9_MUCMA|nr:ComEC/Rec2 family competence protein [Mucilaginibacter mallensis]SDT30472.1 competence protein ComEC [Mucilaginibacter mallensis]
MIANHRGEIPFVVLIIPFLLGISVGLNFTHATDVTPLTILFHSLSFIFIALNLTYKRFNIYKYRWLGGSLMVGILLLFGCISVINYNELNRSTHFSKTTAQYAIVKISNEPVLKNGLFRFKADVKESVSNGKQTPVTGNLLITIKDTSAKNLYYGDELLIPANYKPVDPPFNPAEFNYKQYLAYQNIHYQSFLYPHQYAVIAYNTENAVVAYSLRLKQRLIQKFKAGMTDTSAVAVASAIILGYKADMSSNVLQAYSATGTVYVLTVSGAQVAVIYLMLSWALGFLWQYKYGRLIRAVIIISILCYYALLTGFSPAVCRAVLMVSLIVIGKTYSRYINSLNLLAVSAFLLLFYDPYFITEVGFQLSYIAISGLIIFRPIVYSWLKFKNKWADKLWGLCSLSIAAQVVTFPLSAFYFHQFPVYFLVSNLFVFIPVTIIMYTGFIYLLLPQIPGISNALAYLLDKTILIMNKVLTFMEHLPFASINKIWLSTTEYLLLYAIIISLFYYLYYKKSWLLQACLGCLLLLSISISIKKIYAQQSNSIAFLNLHKHIGLVIKNGTKAVVISDLSDTDKNYRYSIQPYLDSSGISTISVYNLKQDIQSAFVLKKGNLIQFMNKRLVLFNKDLSDAPLNKKLKTDYIYLTNNPYAAINSINKNYVCQLLVIDATNSDHFISSVIKQADTLQIKYSLLKRNKSLITVSNE